MWIVRIALERPYTFIVLALVILLTGVISIFRMPTDIFPNIKIPVVSVIWNYTGLPPTEMSDRIVGNFERGITTTVNDVEHLESQSINGIAVIKVFFQPTVSVDLAIAQITAVAQAFLRNLPPNTTPPLILSYNASTVPVIQLALSSDTLSEQEINDLGMNFIRTQLATIPGAASPYPYGGKQRQVDVDLDRQAMQRYGVTPQQVNAAINNQNLILPSGTEKIGPYEYYVTMNASTSAAEELNNVPLEAQNHSVLYIRDVAHVRDGFAPQTNIVRIDGMRAVLMTIQKIGTASTLQIVNSIKELLPSIRASLPPSLKVDAIGDQSIFVKAAVSGVIREATIAAVLTSLMILLFLGSWRSTLSIILSIPLSILASLVILYSLGETINIMTLGGLALAVGILVDDATVTIENINTHLEGGQEGEEEGGEKEGGCQKEKEQEKPEDKKEDKKKEPDGEDDEGREQVKDAIMEGAQQIAVPALVSSLSICIVFVPMFFLTGVARYLFVPLGEAVVFAMMASYALSRTLVPTLAMYLLKPHEEKEKKPEGEKAANQEEPELKFPPLEPELPLKQRRTGKEEKKSFLARFQQKFHEGFEKMRGKYRDTLEGSFESGGLLLACFLLFALLSLGVLAPWLGSDFFPTSDAGQIKLHMRAHSGTRVEETARINDQVDEVIRHTIPADELDSITDNIGVPNSGINLSYSNSQPVGPADSDILISLTEKHKPVADYIRQLRINLNRQLPGITFAFLPADIISQILNFGLPSPIDIQVIGKQKAKNLEIAKGILRKVEDVPGIVDAHIHQAENYPGLHLTVDRTRAQELGITQNDVARNLLLSLSGSFQTSPAFWLDKKTGVEYNVVTQTPQYKMDSLDDLRNIPVAAKQGDAQTIMGSVSTITREVTPTTVSHYNVENVFDVYANVQDRDLGGVSGDVRKIIKKFADQEPKGTRIVIRGQTLTQEQSFRGLYYGLAFSVVLVYLLIVVNFQSWLDPLIIISALPMALAGIVWMLFITHTTLSVPALTGAIMCMGVATANSILVISFAREQMQCGKAPKEAALKAGYSRLRPVIMTALAMIIGMMPMALALGEGGEQNAPLGRAVIGGLLFSTVATLFFVPVAFSKVHEALARRRDKKKKNKPEKEGSPRAATT